MTRQDALRLAQERAQAEGWRFEPPFDARLRKPWFFGRARWTVRSNADHLGRNVWVVIDDETGRIVSAGFAPR
jgi:hypothetical protein